MKTSVSIKCKKCRQQLPIFVDTEQIGTCFTGICPNCNDTGKLVMIPEMAKMIEETIAEKVKQKEAEAKVAKGSGADSTYVPVKNGSKERVLVLTSRPSELTPRQLFEIVQEYSTVGRKNSSGPLYQPIVEIDTKDRLMSKKHCLIKKIDNGKYSIEDYNSTNGTRLNGEKLKSGQVLLLEKGDVIRLGSTELVVSYKDK